MDGSLEPVTAVIPTYRRDRVLIDTIEGLLSLAAPPAETVVVDQTELHDTETARWLEESSRRGLIRWVRLEAPSIPAAMNRGLLEARHPIVLFLDDDIRVDRLLVAAHSRAHRDGGHVIVAGRVIQPWHAEGRVPMTGFASGRGAGPRAEFMGGNFSVRRAWALDVGGFDERFVRVAYRFEAEFAARVTGAGGGIWYEPAAVVHHLKAERGGTRTYGDHLRTASPAHAVGEYYYLLRARPRAWPAQLLARPWRSVAKRYYTTRPWWIVPRLVAEVLGLLWAITLWARGPRLVRTAPGG